eukprot:1571120-Alexandrium_andersonii.AAC.1
MRSSRRSRPFWDAGGLSWPARRTCRRKASVGGSGLGATCWQRARARGFASTNGWSGATVGGWPS